MTCAGAELPSPAWLEPGDAERHWQRDLAHFPGQVTELDGALLRRFIEGGFREAMAAHSLPFALLIRRFWTYYYQFDGPLALPEDERKAMLERSLPQRELARTTIARRWHDEWLPEVHEHLAFWSAIDPFALDAHALASHLDDTLARGDRLWLLHFELAVALSLARRAYLELYGELFEPSSPLEAQTPLSGFDVLTTRAARELWPLRELVAPERVRDALLGVAPRDAMAALAAEPTAGPLVAALDAYLEANGQRSPYLLFSAPSLREYPAPVMSMLRHMVERPEADPNRLLAEQAAKRRQAEADARERLRYYPAPVRSEFEARLAAAQTAARVSEDHNYLIDYSSTARIRRVFLACGNALAEAGTIAEPDDVMHLRIEEVRAALRGGGTDLRERVRERRAQMTHYAAIDPPFDINAPATVDGAAAPTDPGQSGARLDPDVLHGMAASAGVARGRARVLRSLDAVDELRPGEVLVATTTGQAWTPLFATASALVTESGNLLSHAAVVAREYALPAVVALSGATRLIPDGALVEVDGAAGVVRLLARP